MINDELISDVASHISTIKTNRSISNVNDRVKNLDDLHELPEDDTSQRLARLLNDIPTDEDIVQEIPNGQPEESASGGAQQVVIAAQSNMSQVGPSRYDSSVQSINPNVQDNVCNVKYGSDLHNHSKGTKRQLNIPQRKVTFVSDNVQTIQNASCVPNVEFTRAQMNSLIPNASNNASQPISCVSNFYRHTYSNSNVPMSIPQSNEQTNAPASNLPYNVYQQPNFMHIPENPNAYTDHVLSHHGNYNVFPSVHNNDRRTVPMVNTIPFNAFNQSGNAPQPTVGSSHINNVVSNARARNSSIFNFSDANNVMRFQMDPARMCRFQRLLPPWDTYLPAWFPRIGCQIDPTSHTRRAKGACR